ncbi:MAG: rhodanese-like domain-containing protein [Balneolaceae bacterium]
MAHEINEIDVHQLKAKREADEDFILLDVREEFEAMIASLDGQLIPLDQLGDRLDEIDRGKEIVVMCRSGNRSAKACGQLLDNGFQQVANLKGGINAWAREIDPSMPEY